MFLSFIVPPDLREQPIEEVVSWAKETSFDAVDLGAAQLEEGFNACEKVGLQVGLVMQGVPKEALDYDAGKRRQGVQRAKEIIDASSERGIHMIMGQTVAPSSDSAKNLRAFEETYPEIVEYAGGKQIKIVFENCPHGGVAIGYSPEWWRKMFEVIRADNFGLVFDPSHLSWLGIDYLRALREFGKHVMYAHAKDTEILMDGKYEYGILGRQFDEQGGASPWFRCGWWRYRMPGMGQVDWKAFVNTLREVGFDGGISLEHEDPVYEGSPQKAMQGLKMGADTLRRLLS